MPTPQLVTKVGTPISGSSTWNALLGDPQSGLVILAAGTSAPPTTADVFAHGCRAVQTDGSGTAAVFINTGTAASVVWSPEGFPTLPSQNFVSSNSNGANNALCVSLFAVGTTKVVLTTGSRIAIKLNHTLQKGANTLNVNGTTASIKNSTNLLNLTTGYVVGGVIEVVYTPGVSGGIYQDLKQ